MSRLPSPDGVTEIVKLLAEVDALDAEVAELRPTVEPLVTRLQAAETKARELRAKLPELLRSMDVESPGNFGWERRMGWFLAEMRRQITAGVAAPKHVPQAERAPRVRGEYE